MHTIHNPECIEPSVMYSYRRGLNQTWNIPEYQTPREYLDPILKNKQRIWAAQKKGQKDRKYVCKRGFYMDYDLKIAATIPASSKHGKNKPWSFDKQRALSKNRKVDNKLIKRTYIEQIEIEQKNRKKPGVCTYRLEKSMKQKDAAVALMSKKKYSVGQKHYYHDDTSFLADKSPGSGMYNPHDQILKLRENKSNYKEWVKKHREEDEKMSQRKKMIPAPGTYSPLNSTYSTFQLIDRKEKLNQKAGSKERSFGFGSDARFEYTRPDKKMIKQQRPDPITYNTGYQWREKKDNSNKKPWNETIYKGYKTLSVYNS